MTEPKLRMIKEGPFPINHKLAGLVPMASEAEQAMLTVDIKNNEQREPIVLWRGEVIDGRCRQKALVTLGKHIIYKELDATLTEEEVRIYVKSVNTRRNLTSTQKAMSACRESLREDEHRSVATIAKSWGVSKDIVFNARYITKNNPNMADALFDGKSVPIIDSTGNSKVTNKITVVYSYLKRLEESTTESTEYGWGDDTYIKTQAGKEWYYTQIAMMKTGTTAQTQMLIAELANYKFPDGTTGES